MSAKLKPLDEVEAARLNSLKDVEEITNPVAGKYALKDFADALTDVQKVKKDFPETCFAYNFLSQNSQCVAVVTEHDTA